MRHDWERLFSLLTPPAPPEGLLGRIMVRIQERRDEAALRRRIAVHVIGLLGSAAAFAAALGFLIRGWRESGFGDYIALLFSDAEAVMASWQPFGMALLESLPAAAIAACLAALAFFLESLKFAARAATSLRRA